MTQQSSSAVTGVVVGALFANSRRHDRAIDKSRRALDHADDAQSTANEALRIANGIAEGGDMARLEQPATRDLIAGIDYPVMEPTGSNPFAGAPSLIARPALTEAIAMQPTTWPGAVNTYTAKGDLVTPATALHGQNVATGMALGMAETRAALLGMTLEAGTPSPEVLQQIFRLFRGMSEGAAALLVEGGPGPQSQADYTQAFQRYVAQTPSGPLLTIERLDFLAGDSASVSNSTAETTLFTLTIPGGSVTTIGDVLSGFVEAEADAVNSTNTHQVRIRLDSLTGTVLFDSSAVNPAAGDVATFGFEMTARAVGSAGSLALGGRSVLTATPRGPAVALVTGIDWSVDHFLVITGQQSVASAGNVTIGRAAQLLLQSVA